MVAREYWSTHPRFGSHAWLPNRLSPGARTRCRSSSTTTVSTYASLLAIRERRVAVSTRRPPSRETTVRTGRSAVAKSPRPAICDGRTATPGCSQQSGSGSGTLRSPTGQGLGQRVEQTVDVGVVVVRREPDP